MVNRNVTKRTLPTAWPNRKISNRIAFSDLRDDHVSKERGSDIAQRAELRAPSIELRAVKCECDISLTRVRFIESQTECVDRDRSTCIFIGRIAATSIGSDNAGLIFNRARDQ